MKIAERKKQNNISEYIIFMYQTEDLIRVYNFDMEKIYPYVISHFPVSEKEKDDIKKWYGEVMEQMKKEGIEERGHLNAINAMVADLSELNRELLKSDQSYRRLYDQAKLHINRNMALAEGEVRDPVQICFNGIYGLLLLRMDGKKVDKSLMEGVNAFGDVLSYLSYKYKQRKMLSSN